MEQKNLDLTRALVNSDPELAGLWRCHLELRTILAVHRQQERRA